MSCQHIDDYVAHHGIVSYEIIDTFYISCIAEGSRKKKAGVSCQICKTKRNELHACLQCVYFACFDKKHIHQHAAETNHSVSMNLKHGTVFCAACRDYVYNEKLEAVAKKNKEISGKLQGTAVYVPWLPLRSDINLLKRHNGVRKIRDDSLIGLRGIHNSGQTCFVNCIIQVFMHTSLLRDYFLSDKHKCSRGFQSESPSCLGCEMFKIFQEFYSGKPEPFSAENLVYLLLKHAKEIMDGAQQDAHECFQTMLYLLHQHSNGTDNDCTCIIHQIFTGVYQSDVVCLRCKEVSTKNDPFWDVSLALGLCNDFGISGKTATLLDCITRHTLTEMLQHDARCSTCQGQKTKRLSFKKVPVVLSFHLKRLEVGHKKNAAHISFPEILDMTAFTSEELVPETNGNNNLIKRPKGLQYVENKYSLYAVVVHNGTNEGGHYTSFIRQRHNRWYKCNDTELQKASLEEVLQCEGYLLFYHKQVLEYGSNNHREIDPDDEIEIDVTPSPPN